MEEIKVLTGAETNSPEVGDVIVGRSLVGKVDVRVQDF